jgi:hypothetical protein
MIGQQSTPRQCGPLAALAVVLLLTGIPAGGVAQAADVDARLDLLFGEHDPYRNFLHQLQEAVAQRARARVAAMVSYPLRVRIGGHLMQVDTPRRFIAHYVDLMPRKIRDAIARQSYDTLFVNSQGVMIGNGELWFSGVCQDELCSGRAIKIIAINP